MEWECEKCTLRNEPDALKCSLCEADRPDPQFPAGGSFDGASPQTPNGFLPPTAGRGSPGSSLLPPQGTQDFGSGTLPPQGTLSPNAVAGLMPSPQSYQDFRTPQSMGNAEAAFGIMQSHDRSPEIELGKKKTSKKAKNAAREDLGPFGGPDLPRTRQDFDRRVSPDSVGNDENAPTYVPTGVPGAVQGSLSGSKVFLRILRAFDLRNTDLGILPSDASDPFAVARIGPKDFKTHVVENCRKLRGKTL